MQAITHAWLRNKRELLIIRSQVTVEPLDVGEGQRTALFLGLGGSGWSARRLPLIDTATALQHCPM